MEYIGYYLLVGTWFAILRLVYSWFQYGQIKFVEIWYYSPFIIIFWLPLLVLLISAAWSRE